MLISFSGAEAVTAHVTISWGENKDENLKDWLTKYSKDLTVRRNL